LRIPDTQWKDDAEMATVSFTAFVSQPGGG
jgi:hypothetical protein